MKTVEVTNQVELNQALKDHDSGRAAQILITGNATVTASGNATVTAYDNATVRAYDNATVTAYDNATVRAYDNATVTAYGNATVTAYDNATVTAYDNATVTAYDNATVTAYDNATVRAYDNATVTASGNATVSAYGNATVTASGNATVTAYGNATVTAYDNATVRASGNATVRASECVAIHESAPRWRGDVFTGTIAGGVRIPCAPAIDGVEGALLRWGIDINDGCVLLYKAVRDDLTSHYREPFAYPIGETVTAPDWDPAPRCGGGLHLSPSALEANRYDEYASRFLEVRVKVHDLALCDSHDSSPDKVKARELFVVREVRRNGRAL